MGLTDLPVRIREKILLFRGCWIWAGARTKGYGDIKWFGAARKAHRLIYELLRPEFDERLKLDHLCGNKHCVNPDHLEPVTHAENIRRSFSRKKKLTQPKRAR